MKSSKNKTNSLAAEREEECGIWLDTKELKEKKQQKHLFGRFSGLLTPVLRPRCSSSLNFTQNKLEFPKSTKQSSISSFFGAKHTDSIQGSPQAGISPCVLTETHIRAKRKHDASLEPSRESRNNPAELLQQNRYGQCGGLSEKEKQETRWTQDEKPPEKRRQITPNQQWCNDSYKENPLQTKVSSGKSSESKNENFLQSPAPRLILREQKDTCKDTVLTTRAVNANHFSEKHPEKSFKSRVSPRKCKGKENKWCLCPVKSPPSSPIKSSPSNAWLKDKMTFSSMRGCLSSDAAEKTLAPLFTMDSEGLCVIAHHREHLKESMDGSEEDFGLEGEEEKMLFTQDSEGNMVIKH